VYLLSHKFAILSRHNCDKYRPSTIIFIGKNRRASYALRFSSSFEVLLGGANNASIVIPSAQASCGSSITSGHATLRSHLDTACGLTPSNEPSSSCVRPLCRLPRAIFSPRSMCCGNLLTLSLYVGSCLDFSLATCRNRIRMPRLYSDPTAAVAANVIVKSIKFYLVPPRRATVHPMPRFVFTVPPPFVKFHF